MCVFFFCVKQKTSYDMRISDWSSDVCSSDLPDVAVGDLHALWAGGGPGGVVDCGGGGFVWLPLLRNRAGGGVEVGVRAEDEFVLTLDEIVRASCRERVSEYDSHSVDSVSFIKNEL